MTKKYRVTLTLAEREELERLLARGKADVRKIKHAQILLKADEADGGPAWPDARIAEAFKAGITTVERVRQRFVEEGFASALSPYRGGTRVYERKLDGAQEAHLIALACSAPPDERARWTLRLLGRGAWIRGAGAMTPTPFWAHAMRADSGRPSSSMRFRTWTATSISVARRSSVRERSPSPITRLNRPTVASARARAL